MEAFGDEFAAQPRSIQQLQHRKGLRPLSLELFHNSCVPAMEEAVDSPCSFFDASPASTSQQAVPTTPLGFPDLHPSPCSPTSKRQSPPWEAAVCPGAPVKMRRAPEQPPVRPARGLVRNLFGAANPNAGP